MKLYIQVLNLSRVRCCNYCTLVQYQQCVITCWTVTRPGRNGRMGGQMGRYIKGLANSQYSYRVNFVHPCGLAIGLCMFYLAADHNLDHTVQCVCQDMNKLYSVHRDSCRQINSIDVAFAPIQSPVFVHAWRQLHVYQQYFITPCIYAYSGVKQLLQSVSLCVSLSWHHAESFNRQSRVIHESMLDVNNVNSCFKSSCVCLAIDGW